jgi:hypothetical protein
MQTKIIIRWYKKTVEDEEIVDALNYISGMIEEGYTSGYEGCPDGIRSWELN